MCYETTRPLPKADVVKLDEAITQTCGMSKTVIFWQPYVCSDISIQRQGLFSAGLCYKWFIKISKLQRLFKLIFGVHDE